MVLTAEQILSASDLEKVRVDVPEWAPAGTDATEAFIFVRLMTGTELDEYEDALRKKSDGGDSLKDFRGLREIVVALTACDESGARLFTSEQTAALGTKSAEAIKRVFSAASDLNGLSKKATEDIEKN